MVPFVEPRSAIAHPPSRRRISACLRLARDRSAGCRTRAGVPATPGPSSVRTGGAGGCGSRGRRTGPWSTSGRSPSSPFTTGTGARSGAPCSNSGSAEGVRAGHRPDRPEGGLPRAPLSLRVPGGEGRRGRLLRAPKAVPAPADGTGVSPVAAPVRARAPSRSKGKPQDRWWSWTRRERRSGRYQAAGHRPDRARGRLPHQAPRHVRLPVPRAGYFPQDGSWFVEDLGSTNGTVLNQRKVAAPSEVRAGDRVADRAPTILELKA